MCTHAYVKWCSGFWGKIHGEYGTEGGRGGHCFEEGSHRRPLQQNHPETCIKGGSRVAHFISCAEEEPSQQAGQEVPRL